MVEARAQWRRVKPNDEGWNPIAEGGAQRQGITTNGAEALFFKIMFSYTRYIPKKG